MLNSKQFPLSNDAILNRVSIIKNDYYISYDGSERQSTLSNKSFLDIIAYIDIDTQYAYQFKRLQYLCDLRHKINKLYKRLEYYTELDSDGFLIFPDVYSQLIKAYKEEEDRVESIRLWQVDYTVLNWVRPIPLKSIFS